MEGTMNCWEYHECGREPGGNNVYNLGECPASTDTTCDGLNNGKNAGRICWAIAGILCEVKVQGTFAKETFALDKLSCATCDFLKIVKEEEDDNFVPMP